MKVTAVVLALGLLAAAAAGAPGAMPAADAFAADRAALERIYAEDRIERTSPPAPWWEYSLAVAEATADWLKRRLEPFAHWGGPLARGLTYALAGGIVALLLAALVMVIRALRTPRAAPAGEGAPAGAPLEPPPATDARVWREALERALASGDTARAVAALWWWLARRLAGAEADPSWTSRELLVRAGRLDLRPFAQRLDRMIYGGGSPEPPRLRQLVAELDRELP